MMIIPLTPPRDCWFLLKVSEGDEGEPENYIVKSAALAIKLDEDGDPTELLLADDDEICWHNLDRIAFNESGALAVIRSQLEDARTRQAAAAGQ